MGKRFIKFRVSRVIPSFQSCRPKDPSALPPNPLPLSHPDPHLAPSTSTAIQQLNLHHLQPPPPKSIKRHVSSTLKSLFRSHEDGLTQSAPPPPSFKWRKDPQWHVIAQTNNNSHYTPPRPKIYSSTQHPSQNDVVLFPPLRLKNHRKRTPRKKRRSFQKVRLSTSSDSAGLIFSEEQDDLRNNNEIDNNEGSQETETLASTTDDSTPHRRSTAGKRRSSAEGSPAPARLSEFMRRIVPCKAVEGKVRESFAVVKRSADPYEDFKRSMAEMVLEKQIIETGDLEELLRCFLSLNSQHHHDVIVKAFSEIWEALFSEASS